MGDLNWSKDYGLPDSGEGLRCFSFGKDTMDGGMDGGYLGFIDLGGGLQYTCT